VRVIGGYFPNGQAPDSDKFVYKMRWLEALKTWVQQEMARHPKLALMGDYNITFDDLDVWDAVALAGTIRCRARRACAFEWADWLPGFARQLQIVCATEKATVGRTTVTLVSRKAEDCESDHISLVTDAVLKAQAHGVRDRAKCPRENETVPVTTRPCGTDRCALIGRPSPCPASNEPCPEPEPGTDCARPVGHLEHGRRRSSGVSSDMPKCTPCVSVMLATSETASTGTHRWSGRAPRRMPSPACGGRNGLWLQGFEHGFWHQTFCHAGGRSRRCRI